MPVISIIIRTRNEERWIESCLNRIKGQTINNLEVILVDNDSTDKTVDRAKATMPDIKVTKIDEYLPGRSLNKGIRQAKGEYIVCLSSHCIPKNDDWLDVMMANFDDNQKLAGVYGRQIPMHFTNSHDKRDLIVTFGLDKRVQRKDPFFHNANSMIRKELWEKYPFDEATTNIEDRLWAKEILKAGYHIIYEPEAPVYHHHGIYQNRNEERLRKVLQIIGNDPTDSLSEVTNPFHEDNLNIAAIIPVREEPELDKKIHNRLLEFTVKHAKVASAVNRVIVDTNSDRIANLAKELGAEVPFIRPDNLAKEGVSVLEVLRNTLKWYEKQNIFFDYIATLEVTHPFRPEKILQKCVEQALNTGLESVIAGMPEFRPSWWLEDDEYRRIDDYLLKRKEREPIHIGLPAICTVLTPSLLRSGKRIDERVGIVEVNNPLAQIEIRSNEDFKSIGKLTELSLGKVVS